MKSPKIAGAGICCLDHILVAPQIPWGDTAQLEYYHSQGGGLVGTALVACSRLGAECRLFSFLGDDEVGDQIAAELVAEGVKLSGISRLLGGASPFSFIHVDIVTGERTIFHRRGSGLDSLELPDLDWISRCDALLIDDYYPRLALAAAQMARKQDIPVIADVIWGPEKDAELFHNVTILIAPRSFAAQVGFPDDFPSALDAIHRLGPKIAVITLGSKGWIYSTPEGKCRGEAFKVEAADTTGAGDAFHGAFAYSLARKWPIERCAEFASAVAAIKCLKPGGRTGLPSLPQVMIFLKRRGRLDWSDFDAQGNQLGGR
jgi:sulfofructose kinase